MDENCKRTNEYDFIQEAQFEDVGDHFDQVIISGEDHDKEKIEGDLKE